MEPQYKDPEGKELYGIPDLNKQLREYFELLDKNNPYSSKASIEEQHPKQLSFHYHFKRKFQTIC